MIGLLQLLNDFLITFSHYSQILIIIRQSLDLLSRSLPLWWLVRSIPLQVLAISLITSFTLSHPIVQLLIYSHIYYLYLIVTAFSSFEVLNFHLKGVWMLAACSLPLVDLVVLKISYHHHVLTSKTENQKNWRMKSSLYEYNSNHYYILIIYWY